MTIAEIIAKLRLYPSKLVCITGGEPLGQPEIDELIGELLGLGYNINIETNGSINIQDLMTKYHEILISLDIKCPSSEMEGQMDLKNIGLLKATDQLKFVIQDLNDYDHALKILREHHPDCHIIFTPLDGIELKWLAEKILEDQDLFEELGIKIRVLPQLHKLIWGDARGI
jgi:7-carboxy-7-deazaguanine synthase